MPKGSCMCGAVRFQYSSSAGNSVCHCKPCQKSSGTSAALNISVKRDAFEFLQGEDQTKTYTRKGDSGKGVTYTMCQHCPGIVRVAPEALPDTYILKLGSIDDQETLDAFTPVVEIYTRNRFPCAEPFKVPQFEGAPH